MIKNEQTMVIDPSVEEQGRQRVIQNTLHSPADLTSPSILQQTKKARRGSKPVNLEEDNLEHRIRVKDIVAVK